MRTEPPLQPSAVATVCVQYPGFEMFTLLLADSCQLSPASYPHGQKASKSQATSNNEGNSRIEGEGQG